MEKLFSYGTLREEKVQRGVFGRVVKGEPDAIVGYRLQAIKVTDPNAIAISGTADHTILEPTGNDSDHVEGLALQLSDSELALADGYEDASYKCVRARLRSGGEAWVYVRA